MFKKSWGRLIALVVACVIEAISSPSIGNAGEKEDMRTAFENARKFEAAANYPAAAVQYERVSELAPRLFGEDSKANGLFQKIVADFYSERRQFEKAEPLYQRSLKIREAVLGPDHLDVAETAYGLAHIYSETGEYRKAERLSDRSLKIREAMLGPDHLDVAKSLNALANLYWKMGNYTKAEPLHHRSLKIREDKLGPEHKDVAMTLFNLAVLYTDMAQYSKAEPLYDRSLNIYEVTLGSDHPDVATVLNNLANLYCDRGQYAKAEPFYQRSLKIREAKLGDDHPDVAASINNLAGLYLEMGQYAQAEPLYQRSLKIREAKLGADHPDVAAALNNLAGLYHDMGQYAKAEPLYQRSLKIREAKLGADHPDVAAALSNLAGLYYHMGQYAQAEPLYQRSLKIREAKLGADHPDVGAALNNLASLYHDMGQYAQAEPLYQRGLKIREAKLGADHPDVAGSLNNLANLYCDMGQCAKAEPLYQRGLKIVEAKFGPNHPKVAYELNNLAILYKDMGQYAQAEPLYQRSLKIREAKLGADHPDVAAALNNLAGLYHDMGQYAKAEPLYQRSLKIKEAKLGADHPGVALALNNLALLRAATGNPIQAAAELQAERRGVRRHVARILPALGEKDQLTFLESTDCNFWHVALTLGRAQAQDPPIAAQSYGWLLNGKAVAQETVAQQKLLARDSQDPAIAALARELRQVRSELAGLSQVVPKASEAAAHRERLAELSQQEQEIARQVSLAAGRPALDDPWIEAAAVRQTLPTAALLVDIVRFRPVIFAAKGKEDKWEPARYMAWLAPPAGQRDIQIVDLGAAESVDKLVAAARAAIEQSAAKLKNPDDEPRAEQAAQQPLAQLAKLVLDPLKPHLAGVKHLIISPDGQLWLTPWAALPIVDDKYLIEQCEIRYVISGRELVLEQLQSGIKQRPTTRPRIFADPDYNLDGKASLAATRAVLRGKENQLALRGAVGRSESGLMKVERLAGTADEARLITPSLQYLAHEAPTVYSEQYALEGVLKAIESPKVLVLSTHGYYLPDQEVKTDDKAAGGAERGEKSRGALFAIDGKRLENPLLRCGLLLAGCNRPPSAGVDDGVLTGMEIVECDLRGTDLVVLSACETGLGQVRTGEGVAGLRQAFQLAGAKAVVSTLWRIPDRETAALMNDFFTGLASGKTKAAALRDAQLALIKQHRHDTGAAHPIYWAAFTVTGN